MKKPQTPLPAFARSPSGRRIAPILFTALLLGGCSTRLDSFTGSLSDAGLSGPQSAQGPGQAATPAALASLARRYDSKPGDKQASLDYATALRASGQHQQAVAVLQRASVANIGDRDVAAAYGKALADIGRLEEATGVLAQAHSEDRPNWRVLSTMGSIADQQGNHQRAREFYQNALKIAPDEPSVLNNLGLSYVLTRELDRAEEVLRRAASRENADPRIQANLALAQQLRASGPAPARPPVSPSRPAPSRPVALAPAANPAAAAVRPSPEPVAISPPAPAPAAINPALTAPPAQGAIRPKSGGLFGLSGRFRGQDPASAENEPRS
jgi:Flp pilus assembly protein TadD